MDPLTMAAFMGGSALLGGIQQNETRRQQTAARDAAAEANRYSPWTGVHSQVTQPTASPMNGALQGMASGAMMGMQFGGEKTAVPETASKAAEGALGSKSMVAELGTIGKDLPTQPSLFEAMPKGGPQQNGLLGGQTFASSLGDANPVDYNGNMGARRFNR